jgi:hypothetical protein
MAIPTRTSDQSDTAVTSPERHHRPHGDNPTHRDDDDDEDDDARIPTCTVLEPGHFISNLPCEWIAKTMGRGQNAMALALIMYWRFCSMAHYDRLRIPHRQLAIWGLRQEAVGPALRILVALNMVRVVERGNGHKSSVYEFDFGPVHNEKFKGLRKKYLLNREEMKRSLEKKKSAKGKEPPDKDEDAVSTLGDENDEKVDESQSAKIHVITEDNEDDE